MKQSKLGIFFGIISVLTGAVLPLLSAAMFVSGGLEGMFWIPVLFLLPPINFALLGCLILSLVFGILAIARRRAARVLGLIGIYLCVLQVFWYGSLVIAQYFAG
ncbi:hypothetical protein D9V32_14915 [Mycetocola tolaasinivorans]|uniref:Uncharacterized protein n=1 Tax=Mycetocola tolaasinivorans TaxID=76635 RepID=A0A3L6ZZI3_9MICO|nr:hypothetical protein [Mycetocola tolaasinivorans]RLP73214.1 hypothetical protein D9V32_14915 [Mycetocola tolaasinivorans]